MASDCSGDELPELSELLSGTIFTTTNSEPGLRRSPRKRSKGAQRETSSSKLFNHLTLTATSNQTQVVPSKRSPAKRSPTKIASKGATLNHESALFCTQSTTSTDRASSPQARQPSNLPHVDSLVLGLSRLGFGSAHESESNHPRENKARLRKGLSQNVRAIDKQENSNTKTNRKTAKPASRQAARFVLSEARCNDDQEDSNDEDEDDEDTDLSGFIVGDDAELSYHESAASDSEDEKQKRKQGKRNPVRRRRLQRGSPVRRTLGFGIKGHDSDQKYDAHDGLISALQDMNIGRSKPKHEASPEIEVMDLTSSPNKENFDPTRTQDLSDPFSTNLPKSLGRGDAKPLGLLPSLDALRLSPPRHTSSHDPSLSSHHDALTKMKRDEERVNRGSQYSGRPTTPPATPPRSPSKLKSPSKLLSPSKRDNQISRPAHRQSTDAFWDLGEVNDWHDQYSPKKAPAVSPRKGALDRYHIWSDSESDAEKGSLDDTSESLPSPCVSPRKQHSTSPLKSPEKAEQRRLADEKKARKAQKKAFEDTKEQLAEELLCQLDNNVTGSRLAKLAASSGGVKVVWSKTLRSTAGRANWKRTVRKPSGSPVKGVSTEGPGLVVEHFANIELATKVIDCEERLVNTLAHEFCHLANFMVSGIRDQPHGVSFKDWAVKATKCLKSSDNEAWRKVHITTKHGYTIDYKYLWVCVGRDQTKAMKFLNIQEDEGCGGEYGRHSRSIDTDRHRCGRCKGLLVQVRPKPRASPVKKLAAVKKRTTSSDDCQDSIGSLDKLIEIVELSD